MKIPSRKRLPHDVPLWVDPSKTCYFVTICCARRGINQLAHKQVAGDLFETIKYRNAKGIWYVRLALLMPDHLHVVVWFPEVEKRVQMIVSKWKEWTAKTLKLNGNAISLNIACATRKAFAKKLITFSQTRSARDSSRKLRIGPTFSSRSRGRDSALRCPDAAARRPYQVFAARRVDELSNAFQFTHQGLCIINFAERFDDGSGID